MKKSRSRPRKTNAIRKAAEKRAAARKEAIRKRKAASRKARIVRHKAKPLSVAKVKIEPVRKHANDLLRDLRREEREMTKADEAGVGWAKRIHERNVRKLKAEMRRVGRAIKPITAKGELNGIA